MSDIVLQVSGLSVAYGVVEAVHEIDIEIERGRITTIVGSNGAGKSTIMKALIGLIKASKGSVKLFGEEILGREIYENVDRGLSLVPEGRRLLPSMTVLENLEIGAYRRTDAAAVKRDMERVLTYFPILREKLPARASSLSGGQQQMVAVARALMNAPKLLMLDEPSIGLAPSVVDLIGDIIQEISKTGTDILLVEQNAEMALGIADHAYIIENGRITMSGPAADLARSDEVRQAYLGM
ncbi:branched-chain amino acid transport system ATP-binding protein [Rhodoligotrophos appendicifer]|uniref:ABC transporter ATP-binding protein n=1 Tax=Rhodoligotrophos appendicifer TaxID=987056 RepID=UPI001185BC03|nr:ABC transporter ATP-binding protein [Rhodoligotrophos appendicifer]